MSSDARDQTRAAQSTRTISIPRDPRTLRLFMVAGEHSGDHLGAGLMAAINGERRGRVRYLGVGGPQMEAQGLVSQFPIDDVAVMGPGAILRGLPRIVRRVYQTVDAAIAADPDALVIIDAPEFTHPIARRVKKRKPSLPIIDYVSPSVWAWRPGRAARMRAYIDHVMALLPFEPAAHVRLGGPPCTYVGHPLIERLPHIAGLDATILASRLRLSSNRPTLVVLPGSRRSEVERLMGPFGKALEILLRADRLPQVVIPTVPGVRAHVERLALRWPTAPHIVEDEDDKWRAFKLARAALAASGTVTLELALAGTPMVVAYRVDRIAAQLRFLVRTPHFALANLVLDDRVFPELMQEDCEPVRLAAALVEVIEDTPARGRQLAALAGLPQQMMAAGPSPSRTAADIVLDCAERRARPTST